MVSQSSFIAADSELDLAARVARFMQQRHLFAGCRVRAELQQGAITLSGVVPTENRRRLIQKFAQRIDGVRQVVERLELAPSRYGTSPTTH